jgi:hypothetical protein
MKQKGFSVIIVISAIMILGVIGYMGSTVISSIVTGNQRTSLFTQASETLTQAAFILTTETTRNGSGIPVAATFLVGSGSPTGGGFIPTASAAPKVDAFGTNIGYCTNNAVGQADPVFAVISAGYNKVFNTTCTQALNNSFVGDDRIIMNNVSKILQGVGGTVYFGDPVATSTDLGNLTAAALKPGQLRIVLSDGSVWVNRTGAVGAENWNIINGASGGGVVTSGIPIKNIGEACAIGTSGSGDNRSAKEGIAITEDRITLLSCQGSAWQGITGVVAY